MQSGSAECVGPGNAGSNNNDRANPDSQWEEQNTVSAVEPCIY